MKLRATRQEYQIEDESGYSFTVVAEFDPEFGWMATVIMQASGMMTAEEAIQHLVPSAEAFIRQVKESGK